MVNVAKWTIGRALSLNLWRPLPSISAAIPMYSPLISVLIFGKKYLHFAQKALKLVRFGSAPAISLLIFATLLTKTQFELLICKIKAPFAMHVVNNAL